MGKLTIRKEDTSAGQIALVERNERLEKGLVMKRMLWELINKQILPNSMYIRTSYRDGVWYGYLEVGSSIGWLYYTGKEELKELDCIAVYLAYVYTEHHRNTDWKCFADEKEVSDSMDLRTFLTTQPEKYVEVSDGNRKVLVVDDNTGIREGDRTEYSLLLRK